MLLDLEGVSTFYGNFQALRAVSLDIEKGEIVTLLGSNGAGKTTLLKTVSGLLRPRAGAITFEGRRIEHLDPNSIVWWSRTPPTQALQVAHRCPWEEGTFRRITRTFSPSGPW